MPHSRRPFSLVEWLIVVMIASVLLAIAVPARSRAGRQTRRAAPAAPAAAAQPAIPVGVPDADKRTSAPPSMFQLWQQVQNPLALMLALHVITRALRRDRRQHPKTPAPEPAPASDPPPPGEGV